MKNFMAKKMDTLRLAQEVCEGGKTSYRRFAIELPALYLMQPQPPAANARVKRRLPVAVDAETRAQIEHPVKIIHAG